MKPTPVQLRTRETAAARGGYTFEEALVSPCLDCDETVCCQIVFLETFEVATLHDLDRCRYLLNFAGIELGVADNGTWSVAYRVPCRFLDPDTHGCTIHDSPDLPENCRAYDAYDCRYRQVLLRQTDQIVRLDRRRFEALLGEVRFDRDRRIAALPPWEWVVEVVGAMPFDEPRAEPAHDAVLDRWRTEAGTAVAAPERRPLRVDHPRLVDPCSGCGAWCCDTLRFPVASPPDHRGLDRLKFALGFPGVEVGITDGEWWLVVKARCRHLADGRCTVYGTADRPLVCSQYDARSCTYVHTHGETRPEGYLRVTLAELRWVAETMAFAPDGDLVAMPPVDDLREHVERRLHEAHHGLPHEPFEFPFPVA